MSRFEYHRPRTLKEAFELVRRTPEARYIAGGTDVMVRMRSGRMKPPALVSLRNVPELLGVEVDASGTLRVGGGAPLADVLASRAVRERAPVLAVAVESMGSAQIRSVATLGGNVCNASPCADSAPALLVLGARVRLEGPEGTRELPIDELFTGPGATALRPAEVVTAFLLDAPSPAARGVFLKKSRVSMDLAIANVAVSLEVDGDTCRRARVAAGAVAPVPLRLRAVEDVLTGARLTADVAAEAARRAMEAVTPISDIRGSADYRRAIVGAYVKRAVETCASRSTP
jgi:carbon-monoxide dehydrogenase medium subunit